MVLQRLEVGLVSTDGGLAEFYAKVLELELLPPLAAGPGVVHRAQGAGNTIKVMVPGNAPEIAEPVWPFFAATGLRYLTVHTSDLDGVITRATALGGRVKHGPISLSPSVRMAVLLDPDGNVLEVVAQTP
ncbi:VOC family protein [Frankia sp. EI5c]|uniref:VOC family protein n=1 Tax=Frankia sp. EI5c TaxID=683316 RepID=UPI0008254C8F|nr:VOC family protein [Frankia sp. EI5c]